MRESRREATATDRAVAYAGLVFASVVGAAAPMVAAPGAVEYGWLSARFGVFLATTLGAWGLGVIAAANVLGKLRRRGEAQQ